MTMQDKFARALTLRGSVKVKETHKYLVYSCPSGGYYYLGRAGSLRFGVTVAGSVPVRNETKQKLLAEYDGVKS
jgi:hypothetical protein